MVYHTTSFKERLNIKEKRNMGFWDKKTENGRTIMIKIRKSLILPILIITSMLMNITVYANIPAQNQFISPIANNDHELYFNALNYETVIALGKERLEEIKRLYKGSTTDETNIMEAYYAWFESWMTTHPFQEEEGSPYIAFAYLGAYCYGTANAYATIMNEFGLECVTIVADEMPGVVGEGEIVDGGHAWNAVKANGKWYYLDCAQHVHPCSRDEFIRLHPLMQDGSATDYSKWECWTYDDNGQPLINPATLTTATDMDLGRIYSWDERWGNIYNNNFYPDEKFIKQVGGANLTLTFNPEYNTADWKVHDSKRIETRNGAIAYSNRIDLFGIYVPNPEEFPDGEVYELLDTWYLNDNTRYIDHISGENGIVTYTTCLKSPYGSDPRTGTIDWSQYNNYTGPQRPEQQITEPHENPTNNNEFSYDYNTYTKTATYDDYIVTMSMNRAVPFCKKKAEVLNNLNLRYEICRQNGDVKEPCSITVKKVTSTKPSKKKGIAKVTIKLKGSTKEEKKAVKKLNKQLKKLEVEILPEGYDPEKENQQQNT